MKRKIRIITDVIAAFLLFADAAFFQLDALISGMGKFRHHEGIFLIALIVLMLAVSVLFANDAACMISEKHRMKTVGAETRFKVLPMIAVVLAVFAIPLCAAALFFAPMKVLSVPVAVICKIFGLTREKTDLSGNNAFNIFGAVYIVFDVMLEISAFLSICSIITSKSAILSPNKAR